MARRLLVTEQLDPDTLARAEVRVNGQRPGHRAPAAIVAPRGPDRRGWIVRPTSIEHIARLFKVSLAIRQPDIDPAEISKAIHVTPNRATRAGAPVLRGSLRLDSAGVA